MKITNGNRLNFCHSIQRQCAVIKVKPLFTNTVWVTWGSVVTALDLGPEG